VVIPHAGLFIDDHKVSGRVYRDVRTFDTMGRVIYARIRFSM
jgi:hypothetical protein